MFTCKGFGIPLPSIVWESIDGDFEMENVTISDYSEVLESGIEVATSILTFHDFSNTTEGGYGCYAYNNVTDYLGVSSFKTSEFLLAGMQII